jgi:hypothetical protein
MTFNSMFVRSTMIGSLALLSLFGCDRNDAQQGGAAGDAPRTTTGTGTTGTGTTSNRDMTGTGTLGAEDNTHGTATTGRSSASGSVDDQPGDDAIERTGGRDVPMGAGGASHRSTGSGTTMGNAGHAGHGGAKH